MKKTTINAAALALGLALAGCSKSDAGNNAAASSDVVLNDETVTEENFSDNALDSVPLDTNAADDDAGNASGNAL